jgi:hypothetical protein
VLFERLQAGRVVEPADIDGARPDDVLQRRERALAVAREQRQFDLDLAVASAPSQGAICQLGSAREEGSGALGSPLASGDLEQRDSEGLSLEQQPA